MLTAQTLIADAGLTALAKDLSEIAGRPCSPQQLNYWRRVNAVPGRWLPAVREYLRRQGTEPSADDVDALLGSPSVVDKINLKGGLRKGDNGAKATPRARKQQLCGGGA